MSVSALYTVDAFMSSGAGEGLPPSCVSVLWLLGWRTDDETGRAWPCADGLALSCGLSRRAVQYALRRLLAEGLVGREVRKTSRGDGFYWRLTLPSPKGATIAHIKSATIAHIGGSIGATIAPVTVQPLRERVQPLHPKGKRKGTTNVSGGGCRPQTPAHKRDDFFPPTVEEVRQYCEETGFKDVDAARFVDYYGARGWARIRDWRAAVRAWRRNGRGGAASGSSPSRAVAPVGRVYDDNTRYDENEQL